jgi:catechol 2,3-dioxygenase-like lactoylglutathione lyase family enzyme
MGPVSSEISVFSLGWEGSHDADFEREAYQSPAEPRQRIALKFGQQKFNLRPTGSPRLGDLQGRCIRLARPVLHHRGQPQPIIERWKSLSIPIAARPALRTGALGHMTSIYCEDPDGNLIEVATYSADP